jgi:hypothetical protein
MKLVALVVVAGAYFGSGPKTFAQVNSSAQPTTTAQSGIDQDIQFLRQDIRSTKKQLIASNLTLTDAEATKFWPVYDQYTTDLVKINNGKYAVLKEFAEARRTMTDEQALSLINRALAVEEQVAQLRTKYVPLFNSSVPGKTVATFFQVERRVQAMIDLQLTSQIPLVQAQQ